MGRPRARRGNAAGAASFGAHGCRGQAGACGAGGFRTKCRGRLHGFPGMGQMIDPFGRRISYLRVSVTDRCDLRCVYCMAEDMTFLPKREVLTIEELDRLCGAFIGLGVERIRLTGGEPLVRKGVLSLFRSLGARIGGGGLKEL